MISSPSSPNSFLSSIKTLMLELVQLGNDDHFCSSIDINTLEAITGNHDSSLDHGRTAERLRKGIKILQEAITTIERCRKPAISRVHGACVGGGVDIITTCVIRLCTEDAFFSVKEVDLGLTADLGSLQRLPSIVGYGNAMELALTTRRFSCSEVKQLGIVSKVFDSKAAMEDGITTLTEGFAVKSPLALVGTKDVLVKSRDMTIDQALDYIATWNPAALFSDDSAEAVSAQRLKQKPVFA